MVGVRSFCNIVLLWFLLTGAFLLSGCGKTSYGAAQLVSTPKGAEVINLGDDSLLGTTPVEVVWQGDQGEAECVTVEFRKAGYKEKITSFWINKRHETREAASRQAQPIIVELEKKE